MAAGLDVDALYRAHATEARRLAFLLVGDREQAEDLVQDCFVKLCARSGSASIDDVPSYLRRMVVNAARSEHRRRFVRRRKAAEVLSAVGPGGIADATVPDLTGRLVEHDALATALRALPARQRSAVVLRHYLDLSEAQTADVMGCSTGTVKALASRGRTALADAIGRPARSLEGRQ